MRPSRPWLALAALLCGCGSGAPQRPGGDASTPEDGSGAETALADLSEPHDAADETASAPRPARPAALVSYLTGSDGDAEALPTGPALLLMGGGTDVDAAFLQWLPFAAGGDVVILRTSGADGYNAYLYEEMGGIDSVETLLVTSRALADTEYVAWTLAHAEAIFVAGGDQATYVAAWTDTAVTRELSAAWARGAALGGTSAGLAILGEFLFAARQGSVTSAEALADPYDPLVDLDRRIVDLPWMAGLITDTHFGERDRMGRLVAFLARLVQDGWAEEAVGLGIDAETAVVVGPDAVGTVLGGGRAYILRSAGPPARCASGETVDYRDLPLQVVGPGGTLVLPGAITDAPARAVSAVDGELVPSAPY